MDREPPIDRLPARPLPATHRRAEQAFRPEGGPQIADDLPGRPLSVCSDRASVPSSGR